MIRKIEGFNNQVTYVLPDSVQQELKASQLTNLLYVTDIGYYPHAQYHFRERTEGCDQNILIFCTEGQGWVEWDSNRKVVRKDTFVIIPANTPHSYGSLDNNPWSIYWAHFKGDRAELLIGKSVRVTEITPHENSRNDRRIRLFDEIFQNLSMGYSRENLDYASVCLWYLLGSFTYLPQFERIRTPQQNDVVEKSIVYMTDNLNQNLTLADIAAYCGYSPSHFSKIFKQKTGKAPIDYLIGLKIQHACQMLDLTGMKVKEIASALAFDDQFYFSRIFAKMMGLSPSEYRLKKKG